MKVKSHGIGERQFTMGGRWSIVLIEGSSGKGSVKVSSPPKLYNSALIQKIKNSEAPVSSHCFYP
jgi:hypothetical protein